VPEGCSADLGDLAAGEVDAGGLGEPYRVLALRLLVDAARVLELAAGGLQADEADDVRSVDPPALGDASGSLGEDERRRVFEGGLRGRAPRLRASRPGG
jgi:hypothetical protein